MARKAIREYQGKKLIKGVFDKYIPKPWNFPFDSVEISPNTNLNKLVENYPWLGEEKLVIKPDQIIGKRGKGELIKLNVDIKEAIDFVKDMQNKKVKIQNQEGILNYFIIEKFISHDKEYYIAFNAKRESDEILVSKEGGVNIEENWSSVNKMNISIEANIDNINLLRLVKNFPEEEQKKLISLIKGLFKIYIDLNFTFFEINPLVIKNDDFIPLDFKGKLDDTALFECSEIWGDIEFPTPFGRNYTIEEEYIQKLDAKTGASLKLTLLNPKGRIWSLVAGGGASVIYADTVVDMGAGSELANYGEYSGDPSEDHTYAYAKTILDLMTREKDPQNRNKILLIGGGIANFTDVAETFKGIIRALKDYSQKLKAIGVKIYVRRGGPNYKEGLKNMRMLGEKLDLLIKVYGPETHMTRIIKMALEEN